MYCSVRFVAAIMDGARAWREREKWLAQLSLSSAAPLHAGILESVQRTSQGTIRYICKDVILVTIFAIVWLMR